jgi:hypothetical protein
VWTFHGIATPPQPRRTADTVALIVDANTLWISVAGLASTAIVSAIGIYFTHKSQRAPLIEQLYTKQVDLLSQFAVLMSRIQQVAGALMSYSDLEPDERKQAQDLWDALEGDLLEITQRSSIVMPSAVYSAMTAYRASTIDFKESLVSEAGPKHAYYALMGAATHVGMLGRELAGADTLGVESVDLHNAQGYKKMQEIGRVALAKVSRALWTRAHVDKE